MSCDIACSRNIFLSLRDKSKVFHVRLDHELKRYSCRALEAQNFPILDSLDVESLIPEFEWVIHNGLRRTTCSDKQEISISQHRWNGYLCKSFLIQIDWKTPLSYIENYKKACIILDETTQSFCILLLW